jgi:predicted ATP-grasp superfamily ATP-dependent carboligase
MKKPLIVGGFLGVLALAALLGILATGVFAQSAASPVPSQAAITPEQAQEADPDRRRAVVRKRGFSCLIEKPERSDNLQQVQPRFAAPKCILVGASCPTSE